MDYWYSVLREMDTLQSKFLFSKGPSLNEADTVRPNFPLQFQWRANWLLTQCSLKKPDTMLLEFLWLCWHNVLSEKLTENLLFIAGLANFAVTISLNKVRKESIESLSIFFSVSFIKGPHSVTKLPVMGWHFTVKHSLSVKGWLLFQWRVDWHFTVNSSPTVQGPHFAVKLFWWRDDTLLSDYFSEGMTFCCQTLSVKGWHFAVKLFK